ncbi:M20 family metallo-hydrolase [Desmospora activa]|uniref:Allantoate deiminase/N-carbamoyl-L-amino-acid hydrolase n=1 Tax=Desmospora activa DSM 45169 TaxID=1121389 RepID=A0A2T4ZBS0_9BACL|nr:M20 family metallo-hydrolase [Desmospora activa]PTM59343.1 allantoate deiminase/N-carbamoyl-L-amino-acid hydrolase [Desmospora activa DSM 45169]
MINRNRISDRINQLAQIGKSADGGVTRIAFSKEDQQAHNLVANWMKEAGLHVRIDRAGNLIGCLPGRNPTAPPVLIGSHLDTVINGGRFDGTIGVIAGLEIAQHLLEEKDLLPLPLEVIAFRDEEGVRFGSGLFGSRAMAGNLVKNEMDKVDLHNVSRKEVLEEAGLQPDLLPEAQRTDPITAYFEIHIEQGPLLEQRNIPIGIVTGIAGCIRLLLEFTGTAGHAGTVPMHLRKDALLVACETALAVDDLMRQYQVTSLVGTVGSLQAYPGAVNTIAGKATITVDIRDLDSSRLQHAVNRIKDFTQRIADTRGLQLKLQETLRTSPTLCSNALNDILKTTAQEMETPHIEMMSGAGHDAQAMAQICDMGMILIRCNDGLSHHPQEYADMDDIEIGVRLLEKAIKAYCRNFRFHMASS